MIQKELCLPISTTVANEKVRELKAQCNRILHRIAIVLNKDENQELDKLASEIDKATTIYDLRCLFSFLLRY